MAEWLYFMEHKLLRNLSKSRVVLDEMKPLTAAAAAAGAHAKAVNGAAAFLLYRGHNLTARACRRQITFFVCFVGRRMGTNWWDNVNEMALRHQCPVIQCYLVHNATTSSINPTRSVDVTTHESERHWRDGPLKCMHSVPRNGSHETNSIRIPTHRCRARRRRRLTMFRPNETHD